MAQVTTSVPDNHGPPPEEPHHDSLLHRRIRSGIVAGTLVLVGSVVYGAAPAQAAVTCVVGPGVTQTDTVVTGSSGIDTIDCGRASPGKTVNGNGGNDTVTGTSFVDHINGNDGNDTVTGGPGNDTLNGGVGSDTLNGDTGTDIINGDAGNDKLSGPPLDLSIDTLNGGADTDTCQAPVLLDLLWRDVLVSCNP